jgi:hypothetical protein
MKYVFFFLVLGFSFANADTAVYSQLPTYKCQLSNPDGSKGSEFDVKAKDAASAVSSVVVGTQLQGPMVNAKPGVDYDVTCTK